MDRENNVNAGGCGVIRKYTDLTLTEYKKLQKTTKRCKVTIGEARELIPIVARDYSLTEEDAFNAIKYTRDFEYPNYPQRSINKDGA